MIGLIGISYKSAPLDIRERYSFNEEDITNFMDSLEDKKEFGKFVILSTCNRTEVYFYLPKSCKIAGFNSITKRFVKFWNVRDNERKYFYSYSNTEAVKHLFRVSSGLEAMALGEDQVLSQVKEAYRISAERGFTGPVLNRLFNKALEVGKRVRTETTINEGASSISYAGVELAAKIFKDLSSHSVLLIGAGETGELVLDNLKKKGCDNIFIANRTFERAEETANKHNGEAVKFEDLMKYIIKCDIIITSTGSKNHLIDYIRVTRIMEMRKYKPVFFIDLSVPRNVETEVKNIDNVFLYDIDSLEEVIAENYTKKTKEISKAIKIINVVTEEYYNWLNTLKVTPTIETLKDKFETINKAELEILKNKLSQDEYEKVTKYGNFITGKFSRMIIKNLIMLTKNGRELEYVNLVNQLFELSDVEAE